MHEVICGYCKKPITDETEVEYSEYLTEFFCNPDCAKNEYFEQMQSSPFEFSEANVSRKNLAIENGKLFRVWREQYECMRKKR